MKTLRLLQFLLLVTALAACSEDDNGNDLNLAGEDGNPRFNLTWSGSTDLDLYVTDPDGETISYLNTSSNSGGVLDVDCLGNCDGGNAENITWPTGSPDGTYTFFVNNFDASGSVSFTLRVIQNGSILRTIESETDQTGFNSETYTFNK
jgi:uncharacterized protein YfaP (DUF2135 family)